MKRESSLIKSKSRKTSSKYRNSSRNNSSRRVNSFRDEIRNLTFREMFYWFITHVLMMFAFLSTLFSYFRGDMVFTYVTSVLTFVLFLVVIISAKYVGRQEEKKISDKRFRSFVKVVSKNMNKRSFKDFIKILNDSFDDIEEYELEADDE